MNTKKITIMFIVGIVILGGAVFFISKKSQNQILKNKQDTVQNEQNKKSATETPNPTPGIPQGTLYVTFDGLSPNQVDVKVGKSLVIFNNTNTNATIKMSGALTKDILVLAQRTVNTEIVDKSGVIKAWLPSNKDHVVTINVSSSDSKAGSASTEIKNVPVVINSSGFSPNKLTITKNTVIMFENKSGNDFAFSESSVKSILLKVIQKGMILPSPLLKEGSYTLVNKNDNSQTLEINVK